MNTKSRKTVFKILLPFAFLSAAVIFTVTVIFLREEPEKKEITKVLPRVEVMTVISVPLSLSVNSQGTVQARTNTLVTAEVSGVIENVSYRFSPGSFFDKGDVLVKIDPTEYEAALANAKGRLANARLALAQEKALGDQAKMDWDEMGKGKPSELVLRLPQLEKASADLESARAAIRLAERNLSRTTVRAPYDGLVQEKFVDIGQTVSARITQLARIFSVDVVEVRLPISAKQAGYITLPETYRDGSVSQPNPKVVITATAGSRTWTWEGVIDRTEGVIDTATRQLFLVALVEDPYGRSTMTDRPPLKVGQFVEARVQGRDLGNGFVIPRAALKPGDMVNLIAANNRLEITPVSVAQAGLEKVFITSGLQDGDRICLTPLSIVVDGMEVIIERELGDTEGET